VNLKGYFGRYRQWSLTSLNIAKMISDNLKNICIFNIYRNRPIAARMVYKTVN